MTSAPTPLKNPATLEAADTLERILDLRLDSDRLEAFAAAVAAFELFERQLRKLEQAGAAKGERDLNRSAVMRGYAETRLSLWRAKALEPPYQTRSLP